MSTVKANNVQVGQSGTATNNFTLYQPTVPDGTVRLGNGNSGATTSDVITATSAGNVGIGTTPPATFSGYTSINLSATSLYNYSVSGNRQTHILNNGVINSAGNAAYINTDPASRIYMTNGSIQFGVAGSGTAGNNISFTQAMTLDSSGNLLVGKTAADDSTTGFAYRASGYISAARNGGAPCYFNRTGTDGAVVEIANDGSTVGTISVSGSSTAYNTSSDYRLKHDIQPMMGALAKVAALKPVTYKWNVDDSAGEGFIAHELQAVVPDAVTGEKDAVDAEGKPVYQGIDTSFLVATLTAAIQELTAKVEALEAKLAQTGA